LKEPVGKARSPQVIEDSAISEYKKLPLKILIKHIDLDIIWVLLSKYKNAVPNIGTISRLIQAKTTWRM